MLVTYIIEIERESGLVAVERGREILEATGAKSVTIKFNEESITLTNQNNEQSN